MIYNTVLTKRAQEDIHKAALRYQNIQPGLGREFIHETRLIGAFLRKYPFSFQVRNNSPVRCVPLRKFPFMMHYIPLEQSNQIVVLAVLHTHDDPEKWP
jgi:toxin ParE1/3/4